MYLIIKKCFCYKNISYNQLKKILKKEQKLDNIFSNNTHKNQYLNVNTGISDHVILTICRNIKISPIEKSYIFIRNTKNVNFDELDNDILNNDNCIHMIIENNSDIIAQNIIDIISNKCDKKV